MTPVTVIGAGLAGCECAWQLAGRGIPVRLIEMKPKKMTPAHVSENFAELVCSNSLRSDELTNAVGLLKEELRRLDSVVLASADHNRVAAGGALAVDREAFARESPARVCADSAFFASRYDKGTADYVNCPMDQAEYTAFVQELRNAKEAPIHGFDDGAVFEGCMPVEVMARRGEDTLRYGPLKPVGLRDPRTGRDNYAVVQLRRDNAEGTLYNIVGFQTHLTFGEQKRVFSMIPALRNAEFVRYGVMHRNTYLNSPQLLDRYYRLRRAPRIRFAGQMTGVEGYVESCASGALVGIETAAQLLGLPPVDFPQETAIGARSLYISGGSVGDFQPMNINFGIITPLDHRVRGKRNKNAEISARSLQILDGLKQKEVFHL